MFEEGWPAPCLTGPKSSASSLTGQPCGRVLCAGIGHFKVSTLRGALADLAVAGWIPLSTRALASESLPPLLALVVHRYLVGVCAQGSAECCTAANMSWHPRLISWVSSQI